jgi:hypothetical protein
MAIGYFNDRRNQMKKAFMTAVMLTFFAIGGSGAPAEKVDVCHFPPDNPSNFHTIVVSSNAVASHLAHGDQLGACQRVGGSPVSVMVFGGLLLGWAVFKFRKTSVFGRA